MLQKSMCGFIILMGFHLFNCLSANRLCIFFNVRLNTSFKKTCSAVLENNSRGKEYRNVFHRQFALL